MAWSSHARPRALRRKALAPATAAAARPSHSHHRLRSSADNRNKASVRAGSGISNCENTLANCGRTKNIRPRITSAETALSTMG